MLKQLSKNNYFLLLLILLIFIFGSYISLSRGSNLTDGDSHSILLSFLNMLDFQTYTPSRGAYGHLIPEMLLGSIAYLFGVPLSNLVCFVFFFSSIYVLFITFFKKNIFNFFLFLLLLCSNFYLFFENTNTIDYPRALFFFSCGLFYLKKENFILASIFFALTICSRANFCIFIYPLILLYFIHNKIFFIKFRSLLLIFSLTTIISLIFFIPVFYTNNFTLNFLNIPFITNSDTPGWYGGPAFELSALIPRFIFKIYKLVGSYSIFLIIAIFVFNIKNLINLKSINQKLIWAMIVINLSFYIFMPTKLTIINPFIIFLYILLFTHYKKNIIYFIIILNFSSWFVSYDFLNIKYKNDDICEAREALSASFQFKVRPGDYINYINHPSFAICYSQTFGHRTNNFLNNRPLRLPN